MATVTLPNIHTGPELEPTVGDHVSLFCDPPLTGEVLTLDYHRRKCLLRTDAGDLWVWWRELETPARVTARLVLEQKRRAADLRNKHRKWARAHGRGL